MVGEVPAAVLAVGMFPCTVASEFLVPLLPELLLLELLEQDDLFVRSMPDKEEILQVLKDMKRNASPGPDGLNVEFYLSAWRWIGDDVTKIVQDFYSSTHMVLCAANALLTVGPIAYCDAAFNPIMDTRTAGLGVYLHNPDRNAKIFIQAVSCTASSVSQAEAHALLLAVRVVHALGWTGVSFLSDNKMLVDAASSNDLLSATGHWSIRPVLADVFNRRNQFAERIIKVPRSENKVAHALAKRAFRDHSDSRSLFRCSDAKTCKEASKTYTSKRCQDSQCAEACQKEEFTEGSCKSVFPILFKKCVCKKKC
ncbi:hypothetical protein QYE76_018648 [Lolium multiflorum]|uniref:RNase H type-1 domain-containing protein n=1 Tax=Lolium multiflorum TaxID=4521 RepID=A0AAD8QID7_LOLMU|nr:hypothetical protein QYE76_018648 [Lolium multiflorum]